MGKYAVNRMVGAMILVFDSQLRQLDNKLEC